MLVSIVITTKNEEDVLGDLLESIKNQSKKSIEVVLVDNSSTDRTKKIGKKYGARVFNKGPERSTQRNFGVKKARGKYVLILDADMVLAKSVVGELIEKAKKHDVLIVPEKSFGEGFWVKFKIFEREFYEGEDLIEAARFFKRDLFLKYGGYDVGITGPEDFDLPLRMRKDGMEVGRIKSYILHNERVFSPLKSARKKYYYALKAGPYLKKHPKVAARQGNLLFRPIFLRKWKKFVAHPLLGLGMLFVRFVEMLGALIGFLRSGLIKKVFSGIVLKR